MLHHRIVNTIGGASEKKICVGAQKIKIPSCTGHSRTTQPVHFGLILQKRIEVTLSAQEEHAAVPIKIAGLEVFTRSLGIRLFHKLSKFKDTRGKFFTATDIAIARLGRRGHHAKSNELPFFSSLKTLLHRRHESTGIANMMVCR